MFLVAGMGLVELNYMTNLVGGGESLSDRRMVRPLTTFYKIINGLPSYLTHHIPNHDDISVTLRNRDDKTPLIKTLRYENSFFPYTIKTWKNLDEEVKSSPSIQSFKKHLNNFKRPLGQSLFGICDKFVFQI